MNRKEVLYTLVDKTIPISIDVDTYNKIKSFVQWVNLDNQIEGIESHYTIDQFIRGSAKIQLEFIENFIKTKHNHSDEVITFKNNFKKIAKERGVRQKEIYEKLGIQKSYLSQIFNNQIQPRVELFFKIWMLLGCPPINKCIYFED